MNLGEALIVLIMMLILILAGMSLGSTIAKHEIQEKCIQQPVCRYEVK